MANRDVMCRWKIENPPIRKCSAVIGTWLYFDERYRWYNGQFPHYKYIRRRSDVSNINGFASFFNSFEDLYDYSWVRSLCEKSEGLVTTCYKYFCLIWVPAVLLLTNEHDNIRVCCFLYVAFSEIGNNIDNGAHLVTAFAQPFRQQRSGVVFPTE